MDGIQLVLHLLDPVQSINGPITRVCTFSLDATSEQTVWTLKQQIHARFKHIPPERQHLVLARLGKWLKDDRQLGDYDLHSQSIVEVRVKFDHENGDGKTAATSTELSSSSSILPNISSIVPVDIVAPVPISAFATLSPVATISRKRKTPPAESSYTAEHRHSPQLSLGLSLAAASTSSGASTSSIAASVAIPIPIPATPPRQQRNDTKEMTLTGSPLDGGMDCSEREGVWLRGTTTPTWPRSLSISRSRSSSAGDATIMTLSGSNGHVGSNNGSQEQMMDDLAHDSAMKRSRAVTWQTVADHDNQCDSSSHFELPWGRRPSNEIPAHAQLTIAAAMTTRASSICAASSSSIGSLPSASMSSSSLTFGNPSLLSIAAPRPISAFGAVSSLSTLAAPSPAVSSSIASLSSHPQSHARASPFVMLSSLNSAPSLVSIAPLPSLSSSSSSLEQRAATPPLRSAFEWSSAAASSSQPDEHTNIDASSSSSSSSRHGSWSGNNGQRCSPSSRHHNGGANSVSHDWLRPLSPLFS